MCERPRLVVLALATCDLIGGCGDDAGAGAGGEGGETAAVDAQTLYESCVERSTQYATVEQAEEACAVERENYEGCVDAGETNCSTPATPEECVPELVRP